MKSRTEKAVREALGDFLGILEYKVRNGAINVDDIRTILDASDDILVRASRKIRTRRTNEGFAYSNPYLREAVIVVGPATSGEQYLNSIVHEIHHHSVAIADELGTDLKGEVPAYIAGDTAEVLVDIICMLGCGCRKNGEKVANQKK